MVKHSSMGKIVRSLTSFAIKKMKGEAFEVDEKVPASTLVVLFASRLVSLVRGVIRCMGMTGERVPVVFVEKGVTLKNKGFIRFGRGVTVGRGVYLDGLSENGLRTGNNVSLGPHVTIKCTGSLRHLGKGCVIGDSTGIGAYSFIGAAGGVEIGNNVIMGEWVSFHAENHNFDRADVIIRHQGVNHRGIIIGDDCWIGAKATFLDGARVGTGCVIGAGSVVRGEIPPYSVAAGVPAKVVRQRNSTADAEGQVAS